jgi:hypothetical protein
MSKSATAAPKASTTKLASNQVTHQHTLPVCGIPPHAPHDPSCTAFPGTERSCRANPTNPGMADCTHDDPV